MPNVIIPGDFRSLVEAAALPDQAVVRRSVSIAPELSNGRIVRYSFSDPSIARDGNTIAPDAWVLAPFMLNPVFLWAHSHDDLPIGRVVDIETIGQILKGNVEYAEHPFAEAVYRMVTGGFINATSVGFIPLKWKYPAEKTRFGVDFTSVELLEISQVPVPALPTALVDARSAGIDTRPIVEWAERILDSGDTIVIPRTELEALRRAAKMPKAAKPKGPPAPVPTVRASVKTIKRGLYSVSELAYLLMQLAWLEQDVEWEAEYEGDGSDIPARLTDALKVLGQILVDMTAEEVAELVGDETEETTIDAVEMAAKTPKQRAMILIGRLAREAAAPKTSKLSVELDIVPNAATRALLETLKRSGRVLSADNETALREAHDCMTRACDMVSGVVDQVVVPLDDDEEPDLIEMAAAALKPEQARARAKVSLLRRSAA